jgi:hypothetical protein
LRQTARAGFLRAYCKLKFPAAQMTRKFTPPWTVEALDGGFKIFEWAEKRRRKREMEL